MLTWVVATVPAIDPSARKECIPTKTAEFDPTRFDAFMNLLVRPELVYSIDVPDGHYLLDLFLAEASGDQTARYHCKRIERYDWRRV